ncbi:hypothetical protein WR25_00806 [Diploscapter pachys]|uniref:Uncharacterized protein n=1 Tax=Diploscapter pachys TaxID=2018661 RepID=A0A2A2JKI1_9BILA|nr:hypothetical protein WR25_00806 [Diploscapter pachys]
MPVYGRTPIALVTSAEDNQPMSSTSTVQEILIESAPDDEVQIPNGDSKTVMIESNESVDRSSIACPINMAKVKEIVEDLPPEVKFFAGPFSPMFDALCYPQRENMFIEISKESQQLAGEVTHEVGNLFTSMIDGFCAFGTIFHAIFGATFEAIYSAFHELHENMGENLSHLVHAIEQFWSFLLHLCYSAVVGTAGSIAGIASAIKTGLGFGQQSSSFW